MVARRYDPAVLPGPPDLPVAPAALLLAAALALCAHGQGEPRRYPEAPRSDVVDDYHGTKVPDPFRPLEDPDAPATRRWVERQNALTERFLSAVPTRGAIRGRLESLWNYPRVSAPFKEGEKVFFLKNDGLQNQAVLHVVDRPGGRARVLLDPNRLSRDGTVSVAALSVSRDGKRLAYAISDGGSDWNTWRVKEVDSGRDTGDVLKWVKFSGAAWTPDGKGFYYSRYDAPAKGKELESVNKDQKLYHHRLGTPQESDRLVYARPDDPELGFGAEVTDDGRWLVVTVWKGTDRRNRLYVKDLRKDDAPVVRLLDDFDAHYELVGSDGSVLYLKTDKDAPRSRLVAVDAGKEGPPRLRTVVPQSEAVLEGASLVGDRFVLRLLKDASSRVRLHRLDGSLEREVALPGLGSVSGFAGRREQKETWYAYTSFSDPGTVYRYDVEKGTSELFHRPPLGFSPEEIETSQVFVPSKDGTKVPLFLVRRKGLAPDGKAPTYLYGYGGFGIAMTPAFSVKVLALVERGGVFAQACLRGGSEYGEEWHRAGMLESKQNVFDDFVACAEWLVANGVTKPSRLAIGGGSNGGLLVGAVLNQRPDLFGAAVPSVGVMDMLRFQKFTIGWGWISDYGSSDDPKQLPWLLAYSPLHNLRKGTRYPAVLVVTADHDDRVVPAHSFKYAAALQEAQGGEAPVLIRVETRAGHGAGKPTTKQIEEAADVLAFLDATLGGFDPPRASAPAPSEAR